ncbi:MAG: hypothetical protein PHV82_08765 [Victivallaceae bacterium]|nr:hypothetical protein [Victivallaceae bacterium]
MSPEWVNRIRTYWNDFVAFIRNHYDISTLGEVECFHVEAYWLNLRENGRSAGKALKISTVCGIASAITPGSKAYRCRWYRV